MWFQPMPGSFLEHFYDSVGIDPRQFQYQRNAGTIATGVTPYAGDGSNFGFFFPAGNGRAEGTWLVDPWTKQLQGAPIPDQARRELLAMQNGPDQGAKPLRPAALGFEPIGDKAVARSRSEILAAAGGDQDILLAVPPQIGHRRGLAAGG